MGKVRRVRKAGNGWETRRQVRRKFASRGEAERFWKTLHSSLAGADRRRGGGPAGGAAACCTIRDRLAEFISDSRVGLGRRPCGWKTAERHRRRLMAFDRSFKSKPLDAVTREGLERWVKRRLAKGVKPDTVNADLVSLRAFARWAARKGYAPQVLEIMLVERLHAKGKLPGTNRLPPKALDMGELLRKLKAIGAARRDVELFLRGMLLFGLRPDAVAGFRREHAKRPRGSDPGRLHCRGIKGMPDRDMPVPAGSAQARWIDECLEMGKRAGRTGARAPLVPCLGGRSRLRPGGWTTGSLDMALARLGGKLKLKMTAYQVRHTSISWLQARGHSLAAVQEYAMHGKVTTQAAYSHRHMREAAAAYRDVGAAYENE